MGTNIDYQELLKERNAALDKILSNLKSWNGDAEEGIRIIKSNQEEMNKIDKLNLRLSGIPAAQDEEYRLKINEAIEGYRKLKLAIKERHSDLLKNMQQLHKKEEVIKNYISKKKDSLFIDKDAK
jgi:hypothetical protein